MGTITDAIRDAVRNGPMSLDQIMDVIGDIIDRSTASTIISQRKRAGEFVCIVEDDKPAYSIVEGYKPNSARKPASTSHRLDDNAKRSKQRADPPRRKRDFFAAAESADKTLKALQFSQQTAVDALDVYIHSCVDPNIYSALQSAVHGASAAIDAFTAGGAE